MYSDLTTAELATTIQRLANQAAADDNPITHAKLSLAKDEMHARISEPLTRRT